MLQQEQIWAEKKINSTMEKANKIKETTEANKKRLEEKQKLEEEK